MINIAVRFMQDTNGLNQYDTPPHGVSLHIDRIMFQNILHIFFSSTTPRENTSIAKQKLTLINGECFVKSYAVLGAAEKATHI